MEVEFLEQVEARATEAKALASLCREICIDGQAAPERPARTHAPADMLPGQLRGFWMTWRDVILPASGLTEDGQRTVLSWIRDGVSWKEFQRSEDTGRMEDPAHAGVNHSMEGLTSTGQSVKEWLGIRIGEREDWSGNGVRTMDRRSSTRWAVSRTNRGSCWTRDGSTN